MTSSETRTEARKKPAKADASDRDDAASDGAEARSAESARAGLDARDKRILYWIGMAVVVGGGWIVILSVNRWYIGPPVLFLWTGWLGVVLTARFLWNTGLTVAQESSELDEEEFWKPVGKLEELQLEKRSLLKAIKEIDFDHQMGKMSDQDAAELKRFYRARAIEIIKALEEAEEGERELTVAEKIDRELKARLSVAATSARPKADSSKGSAKASAKASPKLEAKSEPGSEAAASTAAAASPPDQASEAEEPEAGATAAEAEADAAPEEPEAGATAAEAEAAPEPVAPEIAAAREEETPRVSAEVGS